MDNVSLMRKVIIYFIFLLLSFATVYPLVWMFYTSLKPQWTIVQDPFSLPQHLYLNNYKEAWQKGQFGRYFFNSVIVTVISLTGVVMFSAMPAYAFARLRFRGRDALFYLFLIGLTIPGQVILIPCFIIAANLHLINTYFALFFTYFSWTPFGVFVLRAFFSSQPQELEDAALIDGCSRLGVFFRIALPLAKPVLATIAIFYGVWIWNDLLYPLIYIHDPGMNTIALGLMLFKGKFTVNWGLLCAALSIAAFPPIMLYLFFQKHFVRGITSGALKG